MAAQLTRRSQNVIDNLTATVHVTLPIRRGGHVE
jgi:hypothetical protein